MKQVMILIAAALMLISGSALAAVNINNADAEALSQLPYIGEAKAAAIIEERQARGDFESVDGLTRVNGIGSKTVDRLRDEATVGSDSNMAADEESSS